MNIIINTLCLHMQTKFKKLVIKTKFACKRLVNNHSMYFSKQFSVVIYKK